MAVPFASHSSKDEAAVNALEAWLRANGATDIFVDHHSIAGGDAWAQALQAAAGTCRVILCAVAVPEASLLRPAALAKLRAALAGYGRRHTAER